MGASCRFPESFMTPDSSNPGSFFPRFFFLLSSCFYFARFGSRPSSFSQFLLFLRVLDGCTPFPDFPVF